MRHYGGILLVRPLIDEFGVARTLAYVARTPFMVEESSLRVAAVRYQERARQALSIAAASAVASTQQASTTMTRHFGVQGADDARLR